MLYLVTIVNFIISVIILTNNYIKGVNEHLWKNIIEYYLTMVII